MKYVFCPSCRKWWQWDGKPYQQLNEALKRVDVLPTARNRYECKACREKAPYLHSSTNTDNALAARQAAKKH